MIRIFVLIIFSVFPLLSNAKSNVVTCSDVVNDNISNGARLVLHKQAQERAQKSIESFMGKKINKPYVDVFGNSAKAENMASVIEVYWCDYPKKPLHSSYYDFYSRNKSVFE